MNRTLFSFVIVSLIFGCVSLPGPDSENTLLLLGKVDQVGTGYSNYNGATVNGKHQSGIEITIQNTSTKEKVVLKSNSNGFLISTKIIPGEYQIIKFYLKVSSDNSFANIFMSNLNGTRKFKIIDGKLNNIGRIEWICKSEEGQMNYYLNKDYALVKSKFLESYKDSKWSLAEEENVIFYE